MKRKLMSLMLVTVLLIGMMPAMATYVEPASEFLTEPMIVTGTLHTIALRSDGTVWTWGNNRHGQLGDGTTIDRYTPVQVQNLSNVIAVTAGAHHTAALRSDGTVWVWGLSVRVSREVRSTPVASAKPKQCDCYCSRNVPHSSFAQ